MTDEFLVLGEIGKCIRCTMKNDAGDGTGPIDFDIQSFTTLQIEFRSPSNALTVQSATLVSPTINKLEYLTDGTFPENTPSNVGTWYRRGVIAKTGSEFKGSWIEFEVRT